NRTDLAEQAIKIHKIFGLCFDTDRQNQIQLTFLTFNPSRCAKIGHFLFQETQFRKICLWDNVQKNRNPHLLPCHSSSPPSLTSSPTTPDTSFASVALRRGELAGQRNPGLWGASSVWWQTHKDLRSGCGTAAPRRAARPFLIHSRLRRWLKRTDQQLTAELQPLRTGTRV